MSASLGRVRLHYVTLGSTNDLARALVQADYPHGTVVVADHQSAGRGRQGRRWEAPPGTALLCSTLLRRPLPASQAPRLTMAASLAVTEAITDHAGRTALLKWPNDVLLPAPPAAAWLKVAGILVETILTGATVTAAIVGIGINLTAHPPALATATDLLQASGRLVSHAALLDDLLLHLDRHLTDLTDSEGEATFTAWRARLVTLGQPVRIVAPEATYEAVAEAVDPDGALVVRTPDGQRRRVLAADVTLGHGHRAAPA